MVQRFHNRALVYFEDSQFKGITQVLSDMITITGENCNLSNAVRYLEAEGLKNYEFYTRYNARIDFKKK